MTSDSLENIENLVTTTFDDALNKGDIVFKSGNSVQERIDGCSYQVRYLPSLQEKPGNDDSDKDPLAPPYKKSIHVCDFPNYGLNSMTYAVILNKYPTTQNHFLLVPQEFLKQTDFLSADDLSLTYEIIRNYRKGNLVAFYNCGEESGASQKHKHIQFFPVSNNEPPIDVYLQGQHGYDQGIQLAQVPWAHFVISIRPPDESDELGDYLMGRFIRLLDLMFDFRRRKEFDGDKGSYNVLMTKTHIHMIPRSKEESELLNGSKVSIGGIGYAGIIIVKQEEDLSETKKVGITNVLLSVGREKSEQLEE